MVTGHGSGEQCVVTCGSRGVVTHCRCPACPQLLLQTPAADACTDRANGALQLWMVGQCSHREHPGKFKYA